MLKRDWHGKPYYSLDAYCKNTFHHKCYKLALNAHLSCPNRDGTLGTDGCIFCSRGGSGDFAVDIRGKSITEQIREARSLFGNKKTGEQYIAYFQAYTNTYGPVSYLNQIFRQALDEPCIVGISIATRPDCLPEEVLNLLSDLQKFYPSKFIWLELGLQTVHEGTAAFIRRGYPLSCFEDAMAALHSRGFPVIVHLILGLPGESRDMLLETIAYINRWHPFGVKLQLLHVLKDTDLAALYEQGLFSLPDKDTYLDMVTDCLAHLSPDIVVHRVTGDGPKSLLIAPLYSGNKRDMLNSLHGLMRSRGICQGMKYNRKDI